MEIRSNNCDHKARVVNHLEKENRKKKNTDDFHGVIVLSGHHKRLGKLRLIESDGAGGGTEEVRDTTRTRLDVHVEEDTSVKRELRDDQEHSLCVHHWQVVVDVFPAVGTIGLWGRGLRREELETVCAEWRRLDTKRSSGDG